MWKVFFVVLLIYRWKGEKVAGEKLLKRWNIFIIFCKISKAISNKQRWLFNMMLSGFKLKFYENSMNKIFLQFKRSIKKRMQKLFISTFISFLLSVPFVC